MVNLQLPKPELEKKKGGNFNYNKMPLGKNK